MNFFVTKNRMWALIVILFTVGLVGCTPNKKVLTQKLESQIKEGKFGEIYDQASDNVHMNVTRAEFSIRMEKIVSQFKTIDDKLDFQRDQDTENNFPGRQDDDPLGMSAFRKLEGNNKRIAIAFYWDADGKFFNLWVNPRSGTPKEYTVNCIICDPNLIYSLDQVPR